MSQQRAAAVLLVVLVGLVIALSVREHGAAPRPTAASASAGAPIVLPALQAAADFVSLQVDGSDGARVSLPVGATEPRPILIVLHGEGERAEQQCKIWRGISRAEPFVLCPQLASGATDAQIEAQLRGALRELKQKFGAHVAGGSVVLAGFGSGAEAAARISRQEPSFFARLVLVDGGYAGFSATGAGAFKQRGGKRVLFVCSSQSCRAAVEPKLAIIRSLDLPAQLLFAGELPGPLDPRMVSLLSEQFSWIIAANQVPQRVPNPRGEVPE